LVGEKYEDVWFLFRLGDRIDDGLRRQGVHWPPPQDKPPPSITRDLIELYETARSRGPSASDDEGEQLARLFERIGKKSSDLLGSLADEQNVDQTAGRTRQAAARSNRGARARLTAIMAGLGLGISLIQGPGAVHDLPEDVQELGGDVHELGRVIASGISGLAEQVERMLSEGLGPD
jgi:hypothetical protein